MASGLRFIPGNTSTCLQLFFLLALLLFVFTGVCTNEVLVPERVQAVLGKNATLSCRVEVGTNLTLTQSSWERHTPTGTITLAVFNPNFGTSVAEEYKGRVGFLSPSVEDASIVLAGVGFADGGSYTCKVVTFPLGNTQASTVIDIMVEPKMSVSGSGPLMDGDEESVVATCAAERARPAADVVWETELFGRSENLTTEEPDGTKTTRVQYIWTPSRAAHNRKLTCVVRHPALDVEFRSFYVLNVEFAPDVVVTGQNEIWFVGQENAKLDCKANANPPPQHVVWSRLDTQIPPGVETANGTLLFNRPLETNDSGTYRCEVQNKVGLRFRDVHIWIREPPPTTLAPFTTKAVVPGFSSTLPTQLRARLSSPTLNSVSDGNLGLVVGGAVAGLLILVLLLTMSALCYLRRRRTFRGDYYTKQYIGPSDMQREAHELQDAFEDDSANSSQDLKPKPESDIDVIYRDYTKNEGDWGSYCPANHQINASEPLSNGSPCPQQNSFGMGTDCEYVSHVDGSVISRREWYV